MDLTKAQYLLLKIQTFLDMGDGNELSRLEKDLMKSYIVQLYDAVIAEELTNSSKTFNQMEGSFAEAASDPVPTAPKPKAPVPDPAPILSNSHTTTLKEEHPVTQPTSQAPKPEIVAEQSAPVPPAAKEIPLKQVGDASETSSDALVKLFEHNHPEKMDSRFSHVPIDDIASALGLNERIFTLNVLFGGDRELFDTTCAKLNQLSSFADAAEILLTGPAQKYNWADRESVKMAEHFIRTMARKYPNT